MATNLAIDDKLIVLAQRLGAHRTKRATVTEALIEYIRHKKQIKILNLFGRINYDPSYDYKRQRKHA